ncbi:prephenate dehydrogenase/arogenate dehydrogenase family protein [Candidatus Bipolaricaulota bacterium]|nr:prephenate dehydrogenase/arogenate dehydrogenase family protein [Candidatus Bipolaricaulota bacterium]
MNEQPGEFKGVTIVGTGLMGGSFGLAVERFYPDKIVAGVDFQEEIKGALRRDAIDEGYNPEDLKSAVSGADLVVLATPIDRIMEILGRLPELMESETVVLDLGSTKKDICSCGREAFEGGPVTFIGGHPMTGAEVKGIAGAHPLLYENSTFVLVTPGGEPTEISEKLEDFLLGLGADPRYMAAETHDRIVARVSHLPQLISISLMETVGEADHPGDYLGLAGGGFRDMTRIAESPFEIWEDILDTNGELIREEVENFLRNTEETLSCIERGGIGQKFEEAGELRGELPRSSKGISSSTFKVAVMIPDRPGALAEMTSSLAEEGINIRDLELQKVREDYGGTFQVYFDSLEAAREAKEILLNHGFESRVMD